MKKWKCFPPILAYHLSDYLRLLKTTIFIFYIFSEHSYIIQANINTDLSFSLLTSQNLENHTHFSLPWDIYIYMNKILWGEKDNIKRRKNKYINKWLGRSNHRKRYTGRYFLNIFHWWTFVFLISCCFTQGFWHICKCICRIHS